MSEEIYLMTLTVPLGTVLVIFAMKYLSAAYKARADQLAVPVNPGYYTILSLPR